MLAVFSFYCFHITAFACATVMLAVFYYLITVFSTDMIAWNFWYTFFISTNCFFMLMVAGYTVRTFLVATAILATDMITGFCLCIIFTAFIMFMITGYGFYRWLVITCFVITAVSAWCSLNCWLITTICVMLCMDAVQLLSSTVFIAFMVAVYPCHCFYIATFVIVLCIAYAALFEVLGYVLASTIIAAIIMWLIGKRDVKQIVLVSILVPLLMWFVFYKVLAVNIPMGVLDILKDLVDMI